ncbi:hypothetical protein LSTR_LSTR006993 [Laodelphax striatellus]|uniref:Small acidic protein-like domain-containing protein n=1 Tax=Laodelphax striatellus TaxID=195883 RepID=A0A482WJB6_LAOST|nr:hypothetical protein LSTR_LSTR006993 [Laodelphax striatellus]
MESLFNYGSDEDTQEKETEELDANYDHVAMDMSSEDEEKSPLEAKLCSSSAVESSEVSCSDSISCSSDGSHAAPSTIKNQSLLDESYGSRKRKSNTEESEILSPCSSSSSNSKKLRYHSSHDTGNQRLTEDRNSRTTNDRHQYNDNTRSEKNYHQSSSTKYSHSHSRRYSREWENERKFRPRCEESSCNDEKSESRTSSTQNCAQISPVQKLVGEHSSQMKESTRDLKLPNNCTRNSAYSTKIADQMQKRKLLWSGEKQGTGCENKAESKSNHWQDAKFSQDTDGKLRAKFKRLMGMKSTEAEAQVGSTSSASGNDLIKKQEEMFNSMEMQYEVARVSTHTHRGLGLGFGVHQFPR